MSAYETNLDRAQREALRADLELSASGYGDFQCGFYNGDRSEAIKMHAKMGRLIATMDAIGWTEQPDTPDRLPARFARRVRAFARREAKTMLGYIKEKPNTEGCDPTDEDFDALMGWRAIAEAVSA